MRPQILFVASVFALGCGTTSSSGAGSGGGPAADAGLPPAVDAGSGGGGVDAGGGGVDAGTGGGGAIDAGGAGGSGGGSADAGTGSGGGTASDCDGLVPSAPGSPSQFRLVNQDLNEGFCFTGETDGTGHIAVSWQNEFQPHDSDYTFIDPATASPVGSFRGTRLLLIGQANGFMGGECSGADCFQDYVVVGPTGNLVFRSPVSGTSNGVQANDPTGGMIHARRSTSIASQPATVFLDAIDASGAVRWTRSLPETFGADGGAGVRVGVDRQGNVLALWITPTGRFGTSAWAGEWFDHAGNPGPVFQALPGGDFPDALVERVGNGLFLVGFVPPGGSASRTWLGQFDALATSLSPPPGWLAAHPDVTLHMVHGGAGYALLPPPGASAACEQSIEVVSASGQSCGTASFAVGGGSCTTVSIAVGYDGTVVQQVPREREAACTAGGHQCDCTYRYWPGFFR